MGVVEMYRATGNPRYLALAKNLIDIRGVVEKGTDDNQDRIPFRQQKQAMGHAVRANYLYAGVADVYAETGEKVLLDNLESIWTDITTRKMYVTGACGALYDGTSPDGTNYTPDSIQKVHQAYGRAYQLPNSTAHNETCANIGNMLFNWRMLQVTADAKYADILETALYNSVLSGVSLDGKRFFYTNPLRISNDFPYKLRWPKERTEYISCFCCPPNTVRTLCEAQDYAYSLGKNSVYCNLYGGSQLETLLNGKDRIKLTQTTNYPWDGNIKILVEKTPEKVFSLFLRIPEWCEKATLAVNGQKIESENKANSYTEINRKWKKGDVVELSLPMPVRRIQANDHVQDDRGKLAIQRGPVVYCIEGTDQGDKHVFNKYIPENTTIDFKYQKDLLNGVVTLNGTAREIDRDADGRLVEKDVPFTAIPYSTWNNRGTGEMAVWIPSRDSYAKATPEPTIASRATSVNVYGVNDQWDPTSSGDISKPYLYWWLKEGSEESVEYAFDLPETVSNVEVYWLDLDQYDGNYRVPESWKLYYKEGEDWKEVEAKGACTTKKDTYNSLDFSPVKTRGLKITAKLQKGVSGVIIEWKVN
jgi:DUF1680 family protein